MENFEFVNNYGVTKYIFPRTDDDLFVLLKNEYKSGRYLLSAGKDNFAKVLKFKNLNINDKEKFEKMMKEYYLIHICQESGEISDGNCTWYETYIDDILNDFQVTYNGILKSVEIKNEDNKFKPFYLCLNEEELKRAEDVIVENAVNDFEESFKKIAETEKRNVARTFIEFFSDGEYVDIHFVIAYEDEYTEAGEYCDNPGEYSTRIELKNSEYLQCVISSLSTNRVKPDHEILKDIVGKIYTNISQKKTIDKVTSDYKIMKPLEYD